MLNHDFIQRKIKLIQEDLSRLEPFSQFTFDDIAKDPIKSMAIERLLERIVTRAIDVNRHIIGEIGKGNEPVRSYEDTFLQMSSLNIFSEGFAKEIAPSAGLRNILVHEYDKVDPQLVYQSVGKALTQYAQYCDSIIKFLQNL